MRRGPEIWIPRHKDVHIEAPIKLWGELEYQLIDVGHFFKPTVVRSGKQRNLIVDAGINVSKGALAPYPYYQYMNLGTGATEPLTTQTALTTPLLETGKKYSEIGFQTAEPGTAYAYAKFQFDNDEAIGNLTEWGLFDDSISTTMWCRELFRAEGGAAAPLEKTIFDILILTYRCYWSRATDLPKNENLTIDTTSHTFSTLINDNQVLNSGLITELTDARVGSDSTASATTDPEDNLKMPIDVGVLGFDQEIEYVSNSLARQAKFVAGSSACNGNIGEIVWRGKRMNAETGDFERDDEAKIIGWPFARTTISPTIKKTLTEELHVTFEHKVTRS